MLLTSFAAILASAALAQGTRAANHRRHAHQHLHGKRDVVFAHTEYTTVTDWVTVTVYDGEEPTSSASVSPLTTSTTSTTPIAPTTSPSVEEVPAPSPTTLVASPAPAAAETEQVQEPANVEAPKVLEVSSSAAAPAAVATTAPVSSLSSKRGAAYNTASLISPLLGSNSKLSWAYNWGQTSDGLDSSLEYVPMLWCNIDLHTPTWEANANKAIAAGSKALLSFNEPDNSGQCAKSAADAAAGHIQYMNPFAGKARLSSPAITNSNIAGEGTDWLEAWVTACDGKCAFDFCAAHWYSPPVKDDFLGHLLEVHQKCQNKPVWLTEFAPISGTDEEISNFLLEVQDQLDNNATFSFVERYSYFMVSEGNLVQGGSPSTFGQTFAFA